MAGGRGNKVMDDIPADVRVEVDSRLPFADNYAELYRQSDLQQYGVSLRRFQEYCRDQRQANQKQMASDTIDYREELIKLAGIEAAELTPLEKIQLGTALQAMTSGQKSITELKAIKAVAIILESKRRDSAHEMAEEKFQAWKEKHLRAEQERLEAANRKVEGLRSEGWSPEQIARIHEIYGV